MCETAEAQQAGGGSVPLAHQEQRPQCVTPPRLSKPAGVQCRLLIMSSGCRWGDTTVAHGAGECMAGHLL